MENEKKNKITLKGRLLTGLLSLLIALGLWVYVVTAVSPESENTYYNIPVILQNEGELEKHGLMITTEQLPTVSLRLSGARADLQKLNSANISVYVDLSKYTEGAMEYDIVFPGDVPDNAITVLKRSPDKIRLNVEEKSSKSVILQPVYEGTLANDVILDKENAEYNFHRFRVEGPKRIVDQIAAVQVKVNLEGRQESVTDTQLPYTLVNTKGEEVDASMVSVYGVSENEMQENEKLEGTIVLHYLRIVKVKQLTIELTILPGGGATKENSEITIQPETITVSGPEDVIAQLGSIKNVGEIDLGACPTDTQLKFPIVLPEGVVCESGETEVVVDLRFPNLMTKALNITTIQAVNVPEGLEAEVIAKVIDIRFRGPKDLIETILPEHVEVTVDFTGAKAGSETRQVQIRLNDAYAQVGAVGTYTVSTTVKEITAENTRGINP